MLRKFRVIFLIVTIATVILGLIIFLVFKLHQVQEKLSLVSMETNKLSNSRISLDVPFEKKINIINEPLSVSNELITHASFLLDEELEIHEFIEVDTLLRIPVDLNIDTFIILDNQHIVLKDNTIIHILNDTIPVNQSIKINRPGLKKLKLPISLKIPINQTLKISLDDTLKIGSKIPVVLRVKDTVDYKLNISVPINLKVPIRLPINQGIDIKIKNPISVNGSLPVNEKVNVSFNISSTQLKYPLSQIGSILRELGNIIVPF